ncbi:MAG: hypothetical protein P8L85_03955 [Rubripirellula sp.]|nr:hypothetical protein [Rubripirellula sp.]
MEAGSILRHGRLALALLTLALSWPAAANAGSRRTQNFIVQAPTAQLADAVAEAAEKFRHDLAVYWLGKPLPPWPNPCPIRVVAGPQLAAQGVTTYNPRPVRDFQMEVVGTPERILDSVLPHEITHTILATHFGRPLPRWADEGICTTVEHSAERNKHEIMLRRYLNSSRGIAMNQLFLLTEYPSDVLPMYAQGYSVCRFLIDQKGPRQFIAFLQDYMRHPSWTDNVKKHYQYDSLKELQDYWLAWVSDGGRSVERFAKQVPAKQIPSQSPGMAGEIRLAANQTPVAKGANGSSTLLLAGPRGAAVQPVATNPVATSPVAINPVAINPAQATQLASSEAQGWYHRKKQLAAQPPQGVLSGSAAQNSVATQAGSATNRVGNPVPPSIRESGPYQSAHPQPMQGTAMQPMQGTALQPMQATTMQPMQGTATLRR